MYNAISANDYTIDVDRFEEWEKIAGSFDDANIYQTRAYANVVYGAGKLSTLVVRKNRVPVVAALVRIYRFSKLPFGIAYTFWGPLWKRDGAADIDIFKLGIKSLVQEYATRRGLLLRIRPFIYDDNTSAQFNDIFLEAGFRLLLNIPRQKTLLVDLNKPFDELRAGLEGKWRGHLNRAEKNNLTIIEGMESELFDRFHPVHQELHKKKDIAGIKSVEVFKNIQLQLPDKLKMKVFLCEQSGMICSGIIVSSMGIVGITLARATDGIGRQNQAAYLLQWRALQWIKNQGCHWYDLSGVDKSKNPGTYSYKVGFCGKNGRDIWMLPQYQLCKARLKEIALNIIERAFYSISR